MAPGTPPAPGSMTVPPLAGWEHIVTVLLVVIGVAAAFLLLAAAGAAVHGRSEWRAYLDARSRRVPAARRAPVGGPPSAAARQEGPPSGRGGSAADG